MIKKKAVESNPTEELKERSKDRLYRLLLSRDQLRAAFVRGKWMLTEMSCNHELGILETYVLGQAYLAAALVSADLKGEDRIACKIDCRGPIKGWQVEADAHGEIRGFLKRNPIPLDKEPVDFDLKELYGEGLLTVIRAPQAAKHPYSGQVALKYGNLAPDLANYYLVSEQTPTALVLSIKYLSDGVLDDAGGLLIQALPGCSPALLEDLEERVNRLPSIAEYLASGKTPEDFLSEYFSDMGIKMLGNRRVEFFCRCKKESVARMLAGLDSRELEEILKGVFPLEVRCHHCNTVYSFERDELEAILHPGVH